MASSEENGGGDCAQSVELVVRDGSIASAMSHGDGDAGSQEITPLLAPSEKPKINIFTVSYPRKKSRENLGRLADVETSPTTQCLFWLWSGSRHSGLLCMTVSSIIYFLMEIVTESFTAQSVPLFETTFARSALILVLSFFWLRRSRQPLFEPKHARKFLFFRAILGFLSVIGFIYCIQRLSLSQATVLSFTTPVMASIMARFILHENLKIGEIAGLACSYFGVLFIFQQGLLTQGSDKGKRGPLYIQGSPHMYAFLAGLISATLGGVTYCLIRAGAKETEQPLITVFSFALLSTPATGICAFLFEDLVLPGLYTFFLMILLGLLAFIAELLLARALQLEKTGKVSNIQFIEVALLQLWGMGSRQLAPSFGRIIGCFLILISASCTLYTGPDKEMT
ncbi:hypothetical protein MLD38_003033 [Melastoma candidum]|uniref:Uncharacterized protein n=1 Tax=Melastoma candidum TaxID=119954 RepID=A0ACB9S1X9_9MYRT|nr:hypothetical protein MLD38_003033 [Melastoma candidum]